MRDREHYGIILLWEVFHLEQIGDIPARFVDKKECPHVKDTKLVCYTGIKALGGKFFNGYIYGGYFA